MLRRKTWPFLLNAEVDAMSAAQTVFYQDRLGFSRAAARARVRQLSRDAIRVCRFASAGDAVTAASVAFHALRQHLAERAGHSLRRPSVAGDAATVTVRELSNAGTTPFCFELQFPKRVAAATAIRAADAINEALDRRSKQQPRDPDDTRDSAAAEERDSVDEDSIQSFPASDPPGWISMWLGTPTSATRGQEVV
jgi:hypothetical protein